MTDGMSATRKSLEERLRAVEDHIAISQLVSAYGYGIDGRNKAVLGRIYAEDGVYAVDDTGRFEGRATIQSIADMPAHINLVETGCAHVSTSPHIVIDGDGAVATCHTMVVRHGDDGFFIWRLSASRIACARKPEGGWEIVLRQNYLLDGNPAAPALLARVMEGPCAA